MKRLTCLAFTLLSIYAQARTTPVRNAAELEAAAKSAQPGDTVVLQNGTWDNALIRLTASGTQEKPIVFRAQTAGKVVITGTSQLRLGGNWLVIDGWYFTKGHTPGNAVIDFRVSDRQLANHCRVTNCAIDDFSQPRRMAEDYWISFSGQHNRVDHCSFRNKKNLGVLVAVILDDDRSRTNYHEIDHNYFGVRPALASNAGEIIRVGVSQHCQFNSNTQIHDNFFEHCDGETEIVSIKSCSNVVRNNLFKESQGDVVLRHGNDNTVVNNIFYGNGKEGTGGVRVINRGQWVANNFFYRCRGIAFRSPLSLMNGIPNSPANRYVQVTDAVIANNSFYECAPISFCEGSDAERTLPPANVVFANNIFDNKGDTAIYKVFDAVDGISFADNRVSRQRKQPSLAGFERTDLRVQQAGAVPIPTAAVSRNSAWIDSLRRISGERPFAFSNKPGFSDAALFQSILANAKTCGASWLPQKQSTKQERINISCGNAEAIYQALAGKSSNLRIRLTGSSYVFDRPIAIPGDVIVEAAGKQAIRISTGTPLTSLFVIQGKGSLALQNISIAADGLKAGSFIASDTAGSSEHFNVALRSVQMTGLVNCNNIFLARAATLADSIIVSNCKFSQLGNGFVLEEEKENKGYYNVEKMRIERSSFSNGSGMLLGLYRGGNDESTMGPDLVFANNTVTGYNARDNQPLIRLTGVQKTSLRNNRFERSNDGQTLIQYKDTVRAVHVNANNVLSQSGSILKDEFVTESNNTIQ